jgi:hypothetical protein
MAVPCLPLLSRGFVKFSLNVLAPFPFPCIPFHPFTNGTVLFHFLPLHTKTSFQSYNGYGGYGGGGGSGWGEDKMSNLGGGLRSVDWASAKLEHFEKNFYIEDKRVSGHSEREVEEFKRSKEIKVSQNLVIFIVFLSNCK